MRRDRTLGIVAFAASIAMSLAVIPVSTASAESVTRSGSVVLDSLPDGQQISVSQFDPSLGTLTSLTVVATLDGSLTGEFTNLDAVQHAYGVGINGSANATGPGGVSLSLTIANTGSITLDPDQTSPINVTAHDESTNTVSDAATLAAFSGSGSVNFNVIGNVGAEVSGPNPYDSTGVSQASATVSVTYTYDLPTTTTTQPGATTTTTADIGVSPQPPAGPTTTADIAVSPKPPAGRLPATR